MKRILNKIEHLFLLLLFYFSPILQTQYLAKKKLGRYINFKSPNLFQDKLNWLKLNVYANDALVIQCSDKYEVREYVKKCGLSHLLNELYQVTENPDKIDYDALPNSFVIKTNCGYGDVVLCDNKSQLDLVKTKNILKKNIKHRFGYSSCEPHYTRIKPAIIVEKYLDDNSGKRLTDYKIFCFNGEPTFILVITARTSASKFKAQCYDCSWTDILPYRKDFDNSLHIEKPQSLDQMLEAAKILSKPFACVRVDFYEVNKKVVFGEMTYTSGACVERQYTMEAEILLGDMLMINQKFSEN